MKYPYSSIRINGREASLQNILDNGEPVLNDVEKNTFDFIRRWLSDQNEFTLRTSGSTGPSKSIIVTRDQMTASARATEKALGLQQGFSALICLDTNYIAGQMMLVRSLITGMRIVAVTPSSNPFQQVGNDTPIDFAALVPYQVQAILQSAERERFNTTRTIIIGGAALDQETAEQLLPYRTRFFATYGMTETLSHIALQPLNGDDASPFFRVLPGIAIRRDDRDCLVIEASYLRESVVTNDLVALEDADRFRWLGRFDNIINSGGVKIIPERVESEVEKALKDLKIHCRSFIAGIPDHQLGEKVVLMLEGVVMHEGDQQALYAALQTLLTRYEIPREVIALRSFDMTETGKLNRYSTLQNLNKSLQKFTFKKIGRAHV